MNRRQLLLLGGGGMVTSCKSEQKIEKWNGISMGIEVSIQSLEPLDLEPALEAAALAEADLTLWDAESPISRLNRDGRIENPPAHLLACLGKAREIHLASDGLFDPTIHSFLNWFGEELALEKKPGLDRVSEKLQLVDFSKVSFDEQLVELPSGMSLDLNGLAQGYLTDLVAEHFRGKSALVFFGEHRVTGDESWSIETPAGVIDLNRSLAVSSGSGRRLTATSAANHLINPKTGDSPQAKENFIVEADEAWLADALATTLAVGGGIPDEYAATVTVR